MPTEPRPPRLAILIDVVAIETITAGVIILREKV